MSKIDMQFFIFMFTTIGVFNHDVNKPRVKYLV